MDEQYQNDESCISLRHVSGKGVTAHRDTSLSDPFFDQVENKHDVVLCDLMDKIEEEIQFFLCNNDIDETDK